MYPTDTLYGLGADALSDAAVAKIYAIKGRDEKKPIHAVVADLSMAVEYADVNDVVRALAQKFLPGVKFCRDPYSVASGCNCLQDINMTMKQQAGPMAPTLAQHGLSERLILKQRQG